MQCKRWASWVVGVDDVRSFAGTLMREGLPGTSGTFVTLSDFSEQAREEAARVGLTLVDKRDLYTRVERVRRSESCPTCGSPMLLDGPPAAGGFGASPTAAKASATSARILRARSNC